MAHCGNNNNSRSVLRCRSRSRSRRLTFLIPIEISHSSDDATGRSMHRLHCMARCRRRRRRKVNLMRQVYDHAKQTFPKKSFTCSPRPPLLSLLLCGGDKRYVAYCAYRRKSERERHVWSQQHGRQVGHLPWMSCDVTLVKLKRRKIRSVEL